MQQAFRQFGPVKVEWPGKGKGNEEGAPKGYVYLVLEKEGAVPALLSQVLLSNYEKKLPFLPLVHCGLLWRRRLLLQAFKQAIPIQGGSG